MKTTYLAWKTPPCSDTTLKWQEMTGQEFLALVRSPEGKGRYFVKMDGECEEVGRIVMEATEAEYRAWKKENRHRDYLRTSNPGYKQVPYQALEDEGGYCYGEEALRDADCDVERECLHSFDLAMLREAVMRLDEDERCLVEYFYLSEMPGTVRGYEELTGIPRSTVSRRQIAVLAKLRMFLSE